MYFEMFTLSQWSSITLVRIYLVTFSCIMWWEVIWKSFEDVWKTHQKISFCRLNHSIKLKLMVMLKSCRNVTELSVPSVCIKLEKILCSMSNIQILHVQNPSAISISIRLLFTLSNNWLMIDPWSESLKKKNEQNTVSHWEQL